MKIFLPLIGQLTLQPRQHILQINITIHQHLQLPLQQMPITHIILTRLIIYTPLRTLIIKLVDTISIVTDQGVDVVLAVDGNSHYLLAGVNLLQCHC